MAAKSWLKCPESCSNPYNVEVISWPYEVAKFSSPEAGIKILWETEELADTSTALGHCLTCGRIDSLSAFVHDADTQP